MVSMPLVVVAAMLSVTHRGLRSSAAHADGTRVVRAMRRRTAALTNVWRYLPVVPVLVLAILLFPQAQAQQRDLSEAEKAHLDTLGPKAVVRTYFGSGDPAVEAYLRPPPAPTVAGITGYARGKSDAENEGGIDNLRVKGGERSSDYRMKGYTEVRMFRVQYTARRENSGFPPGERYYFVWTGRSTTTGAWKVLEYGTGP